MTDTISLRESNIGETRTIAGIKAKGEMGRRIRDMGLVPGVTVTVVGRAPLKDPVALQTKGAVITLRNNEADQISLIKVEAA
jgi:ferrous iron transport protein A